VDKSLFKKEAQICSAVDSILRVGICLEEV